MLNTARSSLVRQAARYVARLLRFRNLEQIPHPLAGDRAIEWSWVVAHLPSKPSQVLDLGCVDSALSCIAARLGHSVTAVDLRDVEYDMKGVAFFRGDFNALDVGGNRFDVILNCSAIEHFGLAGRYSSPSGPDDDLLAMRKLSGLLTDGGLMILTVPVGLDAVYSPWHRIYGHVRLPGLLAGYFVLKEEFWYKAPSGRWQQCEREFALNRAGSARSYALGMFLLGSVAAGH
jgi:SAM-dependent methyltransferase